MTAAQHQYQQATFDVLEMGAAHTVRNGQVFWLMGNGDGSDGWHPLRPMLLTRAWWGGQKVTTSVIANFLRFDVFKNGVSTSGPDDRIYVNTTNMTTSGWFLGQDKHNEIIWPTDFLIVKLWLSVVTTANAGNIRPHLEGVYL